MMTDKIDQTLADDLRRTIDAALSDAETDKAIKKRLDDVAYEFQWRVEGAIKDDLAGNLAGWVEEMAGRAVEQILEGNEDQLRRYLSCEKRADTGEYNGWTGRSDADYWGRKREDHEWHSVIHGRLFEQGAVALRKQIVDAHRDVLVNERILDLEDQVKSLVAQVNKANTEKEAMWERVRNCA
jgi:hypothetical protein